MARPSKSTAVLESEQRSHRTKAEMRQRKQAEQAALSGRPMRESSIVAESYISHMEFLRVRKLMDAIQKNDALYESVINDYCEYKSDIVRYRDMRKSIERELEKLTDEQMDPGERFRLKTQMYGRILDCDKQIQAYQKKRFDIEKENGFTVASSMRSIPKTPAVKHNPLLEALQDGTD